MRIFREEILNTALNACVVQRNCFRCNSRRYKRKRRGISHCAHRWLLLGLEAAMWVAPTAQIGSARRQATPNLSFLSLTRSSFVLIPSKCWEARSPVCQPCSQLYRRNYYYDDQKEPIMAIFQHGQFRDILQTKSKHVHISTSEWCERKQIL